MLDTPSTTPFKKGQAVVYPGQGVAKITDIAEEELYGERIRMYILECRNGNHIKVPIKMAGSNGMRAVGSDQQIKGVIAALKGNRKNTTGLWHHRLARYLENLNSGELYHIAEVIRDLRKDEGMPPMSLSEMDLNDKAFQLLLPEVASITNTSIPEAYEMLCRESGKDFAFDIRRLNSVSFNSALVAHKSGNGKSAPHPIDTTVPAQPPEKPATQTIRAMQANKPITTPMVSKPAPAKPPSPSKQPAKQQPPSAPRADDRASEVERDHNEHLLTRLEAATATLAMKEAEVGRLLSELAGAAFENGRLTAQLAELQATSEADKKSLQSELAELTAAHETAMSELKTSLAAAEAVNHDLRNELRELKQAHETETSKPQSELATARKAETAAPDPIPKAPAGKSVLPPGWEYGKGGYPVKIKKK